MGIWSVAPVEEQPNIELADWQIVEVRPHATRHFVGWNIADREGRASSAIARFDPERRVGVTVSGRVYLLSGEPGEDADADYTFALWARRNHVTGHLVVTEQALRGE